MDSPLVDFRSCALIDTFDDPAGAFSNDIALIKSDVKCSDDALEILEDIMPDVEVMSTEDVNQMLAEIMANVRARTPLTTAQQEFLNVTSLPVYKMINVHAAYEGAFADQTIQSYSEIIAVDLLYGLFEDYAETLGEAGSSATSGARDSVTAWRDQISRQREFLVQYQLESNARVEVIEQVIARTQTIERMLAGRLSKDLADAYAFSRNASY